MLLVILNMQQLGRASYSECRCVFKSTALSDISSAVTQQQKKGALVKKLIIIVNECLYN